MIDEPNTVSSTVVEPVEVEDLNDQQYNDWRKTGDLPAKAKQEASPAPKPAEAEGERTTAQAEGKKPESGTGKLKPQTEERFNELLKERKAAREEAEQLKKELAELKAKAQPKDEKNVASLATPALPQPPEKPKFPNLSTWKGTAEEFDAAVQKAADEMMEYPIKKRAFDDATAEFEKQKALATERQTKINDTWKAISNKGAEIYGTDEWKSVVTNHDLPIYTNDPVELYIRDSEPEVAAHLLQYMGLKKSDLQRIIKLPARQQFKEMEALEAAMRETLNLESKKPEAEPPKKEITAAKKPPAEVGGRAVTTGDPEEAALKRNDVDEYIRLANAREIAARKKGR